jgi:hypothetical protein
MARLGNSKHEQFAQLIAKGGKQRDSYIACGYKSNHAKSHASHLAARPDVKARIEELQAIAFTPIISGDASLREMGITIPWLFAQYDMIRSKSVEAGDMKTASACVKNVQSLIDLEERTTADKERLPVPFGRIDVNGLSTVLSKLGYLMTASGATEAQPGILLIPDTPLARPAFKALRAAESET